MNMEENQRSIAQLAPEAHNWQQAAEYVDAGPLGETLLGWLRGSGLPGVDRIADSGSWTAADTVRFLKVICGETA